jgi:hypothetical protein
MKFNAWPFLVWIFKKALCDSPDFLCGSPCNFLKNCYTEVHREDTETHSVEYEMIKDF